MMQQNIQYLNLTVVFILKNKTLHHEAASELCKKKKSILLKIMKNKLL